MISTSAFTKSTGGTFKQRVQGLFYIMILLSCHYIPQHLLVYGQEQQQFGWRWIQRGADIDGEAADDRSGWSVSMSADGNVVAIGAYGNNGNGKTDAGHVRVYEWNVTASDWSQRGDDIDGEAAEDRSGVSVSMSADGNVVAIGAEYNDGNGKTNAGHVRVYEWNVTASDWSQRGNDIDGEAAGDWSGGSVSMSADGSVIAIGAEGNDGNGKTDAGHVRVYEWNVTASDWSQRGDDIDGEAAYDYSGGSVSMSADGSVVAIGAYGNNGNGSSSGHVRVYEWNVTASDWSQRGTDIDGEAAGDLSGGSVSMSADGSLVAIGAYGNDGNGELAGHVRVYEWNVTASDWSQRGDDIDGEAAGDWSGWPVSMSADGSVIAIGAHRNDGNGEWAGHVRVYGAIDFSDVPSAPPSAMPSSQPTTRASRTFQIMSSYTDGFDGSGCSNICLTALVTKIGQPLKMRPCTRDHPKQMWFLDDFDNLRLRQQPQFCLLYRKKEIMLGKCNLDGSTNRARFFFDTSRGLVYVQKPRRNFYLGLKPWDIYEPVKLFKYEKNDSLDKWHLI